MGYSVVCIVGIGIPMLCRRQLEAVERLKKAWREQAPTQESLMWAIVIRVVKGLGCPAGALERLSMLGSTSASEVLKSLISCLKKMVTRLGVEPRTYGLRVRCSAS